MFDGVIGNFVEYRCHPGRGLAGRVNLGVIHVGEPRSSQQHSTAAGVKHRVAVEKIAVAVKVQPERIRARAIREKNYSMAWKILRELIADLQSLGEGNIIYDL
jgi:hypothetical protein